MDAKALAFPYAEDAPNYGGPLHHYGLTKRELLAAMALQGMLANPESSSSASSRCRLAVICADALIAELNR